MEILKGKRKEYIDILEMGDLAACFEALKENLTDESDARKELSVFIGQYNRLLRSKSTISPGEYRMEVNKIDEFVRELIDRLEVNDISGKQFIEPILIICNAEKREDMEAFFSKTYFPNIDFIKYTDPLPKGVFDIIFLEDEDNILTQTEEKVINGENKKVPTLASENKKKEMKAYLDSTEGLFLYYGSYFPLANYKERVYFSNSKFSIYARLKELLEYKKYYKKSRHHLK